MPYNPKQCVELFHLLFLNQLGRKLDKKFYALKGGCNMRFYFNSIRYSEDMDIDIQIIARDTLRNKISQILSGAPFKNILQAKNIQIIDTSEPKQTDTTQRWKIALKTSATIMPINTKIEFSRRSLDPDFLFEGVNPLILREYSLPPVVANHYSVNTMYAQKVLALALRNQTQARDIFDLYFLISSGFQLKLTDKKAIAHIHQAKENAISVSFDDFKGQVLAYLVEDYYAQYNDKKVWDDMVSTVIDALDESSNEAD